MVFTKKQLEELLEASKPLVKWLNDNIPHPHVEVTVSKVGAEVKESLVSVVTHEFVKD